MLNLWYVTSTFHELFSMLTSSQQEASIKKHITSMGGLVSNSLTSHTKYLVVCYTNTNKYRHAVKCRPDIIFVTTDFINSIHKRWMEGEDIDILSEMKKGLARPFTNLIVCITNIGKQNWFFFSI